MSKDYKMPPIDLGQMIVWHSDGDTKTPPVVAIVTHVGTRALNISLIQRDCVQFIPTDGVRHVSDPQLEISRESGAWDYHPHDKAVSKELEKLHQLIEDLTGGGKKKSAA